MCQEKIGLGLRLKGNSRFRFVKIFWKKNKSRDSNETCITVNVQGKYFRLYKPTR